jgi:hypothetical protein
VKIKENLVLRQVANTWVVLPVGQATADFTGMLTLNNSGALLWKALEQGGNRETLAEVLTGNYAVSLETALTDVDAFLVNLRTAGCLAE